MSRGAPATLQPRPGAAREALRRAAAFVFVADLDQPEPDPEASHHLLHALRLRPGERLAAGDGAGSWRICELAGTAPAPPRGRREAPSARLEPAGPIVTEPAPLPRLGVGFALTKGDRPEWTVQKLTELGVDDLHPFVSDRSVVRLDGAGARARLERLRRVALEAAAQSRRPRLPVLSELAPLADLLAAMGAAGGAVALAEPGAGPIPASCTTVLVGPEGGFSEEELDLGATRAGLGSLVLRAETAAVAAGCLLVARRDGFEPENQAG